MHPAINTVFYALLFAPQIGLADAIAKQGGSISGMENPMSFSYVIQILISFLAVVAFIFLLAWFMRKTGRFGSGAGQAIKIVSTLSLGMREKIMVLNIGGTNIVVGVAPGQIRTLHVLDSELDINKESAGSNFNPKGFKQLLDRFSK